MKLTVDVCNSCKDRTKDAQVYELVRISNRAHVAEFALCDTDAQLLEDFVVKVLRMEPGFAVEPTRAAAKKTTTRKRTTGTRKAAASRKSRKVVSMDEIEASKK